MVDQQADQQWLEDWVSKTVRESGSPPCSSGTAVHVSAHTHACVYAWAGTHIQKHTPGVVSLE